MKRLFITFLCLGLLAGCSDDGLSDGLDLCLEMCDTVARCVDEDRFQADLCRSDCEQSLAFDAHTLECLIESAETNCVNNLKEIQRPCGSDDVFRSQTPAL